MSLLGCKSLILGVYYEGEITVFQRWDKFQHAPLPSDSQPSTSSLPPGSSLPTQKYPQFSHSRFFSIHGPHKSLVSGACGFTEAAAMQSAPVAISCKQETFLQTFLAISCLCTIESFCDPLRAQP